MSFALDTTVVVRVLTGTPTELAALARRTIGAASVPVTISDLVVSEAYFTLRHHYKVTQVDALESLHAMLSDPTIRALGQAPAVISEMLGSATGVRKPGLMDRLIEAEYRDAGFDVLTFDRDMSRLPAARLLKDDAATS